MCSLPHFSLVAIVTAAARVSMSLTLVHDFCIKDVHMRIVLFLEWLSSVALHTCTSTTVLIYTFKMRYLIGTISSARNTMYLVCFDMASTMNLIYLLANVKMLLVIFMPHSEQIKDIPAKQIHQRSGIQYFSISILFA